MGRCEFYALTAAPLCHSARPTECTPLPVRESERREADGVALAEAEGAAAAAAAWPG